MSTLLQLMAAAKALAEIVNDPTTMAIVDKLREWFASLPLWQQTVVASQFEPFKGYGCSHDPDNCPDCPDDCKPLFNALIEAAKQGG